MAKIVKPKVYLIGETMLNYAGLDSYLEDTQQTEFMHSSACFGIHPAEILVSFCAKLCYGSLVSGKNQNLSRIRPILDNLRSTIAHGHLSVWEHVQVNFVFANVSRILTHELVRHRVGTAFSQTSGRYVRNEEISVVVDPVLEAMRTEVEQIIARIEADYQKLVALSGIDQEKDFEQKKKLTSALRRVLPNGQANEIAFSANLRALRHQIQLRTSRHAEYEIRDVFNQVYRICKDRFPACFEDAKERDTEDGLIEVYGMRMQPYDAETGGTGGTAEKNC